MSETFARWALKLLQRIVALEPGRYVIVLTVTKDGCDWTVTRLGKVEK